MQYKMLIANDFSSLRFGRGEWSPSQSRINFLELIMLRPVCQRKDLSNRNHKRLLKDFQFGSSNGVPIVSYCITQTAL